MEYVRVHGTIANPLSRNLKDELEFIADAGAIYTVIPKTSPTNYNLKKRIREDLKQPAEKSSSTRFQKHT